MAGVFVSVGSNVRPEENLRLACRELRRRFGELDLSPVYRNPPVGFEGEDFLNLVVGFESAQSPQAIHAELEAIHELAGRVRGGERFGPRTLDLDLLLYGDRVERRRAPALPREDVMKYDFVLRPLADIAPELRHPVDGRTMAELWADYDRAGRRLARENFEIDADST